VLIESCRSEARFHVRARDHLGHVAAATGHIRIERFIEHNNEDTVCGVLEKYDGEEYADPIYL
jgi:hypothetical protein